MLKGGHTLYRFATVLKRLKNSQRLAGLLGDLQFLDKITDQLEHVLLWSKIEGLVDSDKVFKILEFHRLTNPSGLTAWEIFEKAAPDLKKQGRGIWRGDVMRPTLDAAMKSVYEGYAAGTYGLDKIPTISQMKGVLKGLGGQYQVSTKWEPMLDRHHVVPVYIQKYFNLLNPNHTLPRNPDGSIDFDQCPGLSIWWEEHRGAGDSIHGRMRDAIRETGNHGFGNATELFNAVDEFYRIELGRPGEAKAFREYLNLHGLP